MLASCVGPDGLPPHPPLPPLPLLPGLPPPPRPGYADSRQPTYASDEYRNGFDIGSRDASYGYPADSRRAYERFGEGAETSFIEGYNDGYLRNQRR